ncbi:MAG: hypothetical protein HYX89_02415 [Chloroflexi bacterium]|nr:hypothetical protein [Chloroflexota bacterium]
MRQSRQAYRTLLFSLLAIPLFAPACTLAGREATPVSLVTPLPEITAVVRTPVAIGERGQSKTLDRPPPAYLSAGGARQEDELGSFCWAHRCVSGIFLVPTEALAISYGSPIELELAHLTQPSEVFLSVYHYQGKPWPWESKSVQTGFYNETVLSRKLKPERVQEATLALVPGDYALSIGVSWPTPGGSSAGYGFHLVVLNQDGSRPVPKLLVPGATLFAAGAQYGQRGAHMWNDGTAVITVDATPEGWREPLFAFSHQPLQLEIRPYNVALMGELDVVVAPVDAVEGEQEVARLPLPSLLRQDFDLALLPGRYYLTVIAPYDAGTVPYRFFIDFDNEEQLRRRRLP